MHWIELITLLVIIQLIVFGIFVSRARQKYGLALPAMSGNAKVECYIRGHLNSVEWIVIFLPALWLATPYGGPYLTASIGLIYLLGRTVYFVGYVQAPKRRMIGFMISLTATAVLIVLALMSVAVEISTEISRGI